MLGVKFIKVEPTEYVIQYQGGRVVRQGAGLSFLYYAPTTSLVRVPLGSTDVEFIFDEVTADFQKVTVQGQLSFRVADPVALSQMMNYTLTASSKGYTTEDPSKLSQRLISRAKVLASAALKTMPLRQGLKEVDHLAAVVKDGLAAADSIQAMGIEILGVSILAVKPTPETSRALEAEAREKILLEADEAIYRRRNSAVEQERAIKENELNTEVAIENKKRQIRETQLEAEKSVQQKQRELQEADMATRIALEEKNQDLLALATANAREEADAKAYGVSAMMEALAKTDPKMLQALSSAHMDPSQLVAVAFRDLAENAGKIGELNISPDLLSQLLSKESAA